MISEKNVWSIRLIFFVGVVIFGLYGWRMELIQLAYSFFASPLPQPILDDSFEIGQYYFNQGFYADGTYDLVKARHYYTESILDDPSENSLVWYQLGRIDFLEGRFSDAIYKFNQQIKYFDDTRPNVYYMLGLTYGYRARSEQDKDDWQKAEEYFTKYIEYDPIAPWPRVDLAWVYFSQGKYAEMKSVLEAGLALNPDNAWLLNMYGLALFNTGNVELAKENFLAARSAAAKLTTEDWGRIYPGNNPKIWGAGLTEFRALIDKNVALVDN